MYIASQNKHEDINKKEILSPKIKMDEVQNQKVQRKPDMDSWNKPWAYCNGAKCLDFKKRMKHWIMKAEKANWGLNTKQLHTLKEQANDRADNKPKSYKGN